ncbi:MAG: hypothetical protein ACOCQN_01365 [Halanaerobiaceae bacterium]
MTQPVNPNTDIPMSLRVEKLQQLKQVHNMQQQGHLSQQDEIENRLKQQRVNDNTETDGTRIREKDEKNQSGSEDNKKDRDNETDKKEDKKIPELKKGGILDVKV